MSTSSKWWHRVKSKTKKVAKAQAKKAWKNTKSKSKAHRDKRKKQRAVSRLVRRDHRSLGATRSQSFWARHHVLADWKDAVVQKGHEVLDQRELRSGVITQDELDALDSFDGPEQWRKEMARRRAERYRAQRARDRDIDHGPLVMVYGGGAKAGVPRVQHVGFRPPPPRVSVLHPSRPTFQAPMARVRRVKRKNRVSNIVKQWKPQLTTNARNAMAADVNLSGALRELQSFAEQFPETRSQVHESLGKLAEFGKGYSTAMETYQRTLAAGLGDENPGLPPEVLQHLAPLEEVGEVIERSSQAVIAAWEDYFADAIRVAQDEHVPSKQALTS